MTDPAAESLDRTTQPRQSLDAASARRVAWGGAIGSAMEFYDFGVYGYLASTLAAVFFPKADTTAGLLATFAVFAAAFVVRPIGGILFGHIGDRTGRKRVLTLTILSMAAATFVIGLLPGYGGIGVAAPILLFVLRCLQGLAAGGEIAGAVSYVAEAARPMRRAVLCSTPGMGSLAGFLIASGLVAVLNQALTTEQMVSWGWRIPFLIALPAGAVGLYVRSRLEDSPAFERIQRGDAIAKVPLAETFRAFPQLATGLALPVVNVAGYYLVFLYMPTYLKQNMHFSSATASWLTACGIIVAIAALPVFGYLADRFGRRVVLGGSAAAFLVLTLPLFLLIRTGNVVAVVAALIVLALVQSATMGAMFTALAEVFPTRIRFTGIAVSYNVAAAAIGGTAPYISTWLIARTGNALAPSFYLMVTSLITLIAVAKLRDRHGEMLPDT
ncbi:MFS transporter [Amycolatopsis jejuensis]|uniref:MFS transporter n=1 Tax=Amycolatopsis jejuensis TaxID=330084 RepID=UPI00068F721C|nr:MFS transporter [Amycolatopsis jejuensis]